MTEPEYKSGCHKGNLTFWDLVANLIEGKIYIYSWGNNPKRATMKGRKCRALRRYKRNSALVEFENGQREVVSRNALRKAG